MTFQNQRSKKEVGMKASAAAMTRSTAKEPRKRQRSPQQIQRQESTRLALLEAAGRMIGKYGYSGCTIARVTARAKIAHGTFYLHFKSQQDLFDHVLPVLGSKMLEVIGDAIHDPRDVIDLERRGFQANFDYLTSHPYMYRVLTEAELFAPKAFEIHMDRVVKGYARSLQRSKFAHQLKAFDADELETIATMLVGARTYLLMRYGVIDNVVKALPSGKLDIYLKFIANGITGQMNGKADR
jgi:AcrR family transcriptional regulator